MATERQVDEAIKRMKMLKLAPQVIKEFKEERKLNRSEDIGALYWLDETEQKMVEEFENDNNAVVYHVIKSHTNIGLMYSLMYVSAYEEEWEMDIQDIKGGYAFVYCVNSDYPDCSEFGSIGIRPAIGGVIRTC